MFNTLIIALIILWFTGMMTMYSFGGFIHALLALAVIMIMVRVVQSRNVLVQPWHTKR